MRTVLINFTRPDHATRPGGIVMRERPDDGYLIVHYFGRERGSKVPTDYHMGSYFAPGEDQDRNATAEFRRRVALARGNVRGGSLIADDQLEAELRRETEKLT